MAELTQSEFDHVYLRRGVEDFDRVLEALQADGTLTIVDDLDDAQIESARAELASHTEKRQKEIEKEEEERRENEEADREIADLQAKAALQTQAERDQASALPVETGDEETERSGNPRSQGEGTGGQKAQPGQKDKK